MDPVEKFGKFVVENLRDRAIEQYLMMQEGRLRAPAIQGLQSRLLKLPKGDRELVLKIVTDVINVVTHDILFGFQDAHDRQIGIEVTVDGTNVAEASGMLHSEPLGENGWVKKFSKYPQP